MCPRLMDVYCSRSSIFLIFEFKFCWQNCWYFSLRSLVCLLCCRYGDQLFPSSLPPNNFLESLHMSVSVQLSYFRVINGFFDLLVYVSGFWPSTTRLVSTFWRSCWRYCDSHSGDRSDFSAPKTQGHLMELCFWQAFAADPCLEDITHPGNGVCLLRNRIY